LDPAGDAVEDVQMARRAAEDAMHRAHESPLTSPDSEEDVYDIGDIPW
jgi:hypothetical protein